MVKIAEIIEVSGGRDAISISPQEAIPTFVRHLQYIILRSWTVISIYGLSQDVDDVEIGGFSPFSGGS